jgi:hypothetical protein
MIYSFLDNATSSAYSPSREKWLVFSSHYPTINKNNPHAAFVPLSIKDLLDLEKLDLRWNRLAVYPHWLQQLEERGCIVYT